MYKIRLKNSSINKGKSGGFRVIYYLITKENTIEIMNIFSKNEKENLTKEETKDLIDKVKNK